MSLPPLTQTEWDGLPPFPRSSTVRGWGERSAATTAFAPCCCSYPSFGGRSNYGKHEFSETASTLHARLFYENNLIVDWIARVPATGKGLGNRDEPIDTWE